MDKVFCELFYDDEDKSRYSLSLPFSPRIGEYLDLDWYSEGRMAGRVVDVRWRVEYESTTGKSHTKQWVTAMIVLRKE